MNKNILLATEIDNNKKSIQTEIEINIINFNKTRLRRKLKEIRDKLKLEFPDNHEKQILSKEEIQKITAELIIDDEANNFRIQQAELLQIEKENYYIIRQTINGLNDLNEFSSEIEKNNIQTIDNFLKYSDVIKHSLNKLKLFQKILLTRKELIKIHISLYDNKKLSFKITSNQLLLNMRELYNVDKNIDDIVLYEKFEMESNIDMSQKLSDIYFKASLKNNENIINDLLNPDKNNPISQFTYWQLLSNKLFAIFLGQNFISNNKVTCLKTMYVNNVNNEMIYCTRTIGELLIEITNPKLENIDKAFRQQIYSTYDGTRPSTDEYYKWNGLQVYDIDLKEWDGSIELLKLKLSEYLEDFNWFLWICRSASGRGIHIFTKVSPPHHIYTIPKENEYIGKYWFKVNYETKLSTIYDILYRLNKDQRSGINFPNNYFNEESNFFELTNKIYVNSEAKLVGVDNTVGRITSGIRLTYDPKPIINNNFIDLHVGLNLCQTLDGFDSQETIKRVLLRESKIALKFRNIIDNDLTIQKISDFLKNKPEAIDLTKFISLGVDINQVKSLPRNSINYQLRYNVCNTLASIFGKEGLNIAHTILDSSGCKNVGEINAFYSCAMSNRKNPSKFGLDILQKCGIIKSVEPELKEYVSNNFKNGIRKAIENSLNNKLIKANIELGNNEYLSDKQDILLNPKQGGITNSKINIIFAPPGTGKTNWVKTLAKTGKRILLVLPYISVIKNKIETDPEIMKMFECYYGSKDIKMIDYGINAVTTFDKFARSNYEKISKMFDFIFIDEVHLLFTSSYRIEATSNVIKKIKELFFISSNDPFSAKICLMTGTPVGEEYFFSNVANIIRVNKRSLNKTMEFLICDDSLDSITRLADKVANLVLTGYKILIPTNKGEIYSEKIIGMIEYLVGREIKYGYYKRSNTDQEICRLINDNNTIGDYEIVFCSNYLSVGVDINDSTGSDVNFASVYFGDFSGYEVEQFNARIRKNGIKSVYCIQTEKNDGTINDLLLEEPDLLLKITQEDVENFTDDKAISEAKQEFIAQYDPVLHKISTPGFSYLNGKIRFNLEEYELVSFENKYNEVMTHPVKVARELSKYGYAISISNEFDGLELTKQNELKSIGIAAAKEEKIRKHSLLVGTFYDLVNKNTFINKNGLEFNGVINWIGKNPDLIFEDRDMTEGLFVHIEFDLFASPQKVICKSKEALDAMFKPAKYLISKYSVTKTLDIINQYIDETGILKQKNFQRAINLLKLVDSSDANELADPLTKILEKMYEFVDEFEIAKDVRIGYNTYKSTIENWTNLYIDLIGIKINTKYAFDKLSDSITEMLADIATKSTGKAGIRFAYNKMPDQNSSSVLNRRSVDSMVSRMFNLTTEVINSNKKKNPRNKHIILQPQEF
jgi:hypothetical protein